MDSCDEVRKFLHSYLDNELEVKELLQVNLHLKECRFCSKVFKEEEKFLRLFRESYTGISDYSKFLLKKTDNTNPPFKFPSNIIYLLFKSFLKIPRRKVSPILFSKKANWVLKVKNLTRLKKFKNKKELKVPNKNQDSRGD